MQIYGIVALDRDEDMEHLYFTIETTSPDFRRVLKKCNDHLGASMVTHARLVNALVTYCTSESKVPELDKYEKIIRAFMGPKFDIASLGKWTTHSNELSFNRDKHPDGTYVFIYQTSRDDEDKDR
jgi:hypothetical protein